VNGTLPKPPADLTDDAAWRQWVIDRLAMMPCVRHDEAISKLEAGSARAAGQRSMLRMALPWVIPIITALCGGLAVIKYGPAPAVPPAPPAPHVTTAAP